MKVLVRADASDRVGAGHLMRSTALAQYLTKQGIEVFFLTATKDEKLKAYLKTQSFKVEFLSLPDDECGSKKDLTATLAASSRGIDWVVLDNDYYDGAFQGKIKDTGASLLVIDDRNEREFNASVLVNHNLNALKQDYKPHPETQYLLGPKYALLRQELVKFPQRKQKGMTNLLITMGGSVQSEACEKAVRAVKKIKDARLHVKVVGGFAEKMPVVHGESFHQIEKIEATFEMAKLYDWADFAICAGGGSSLELCFFGVVGLIGSLAEHQTPVADSLARAGVFKSVGWYKDVSAENTASDLLELLKHPKDIQEMRRKARALVDDKGPGRIWNAIQKIQSSKLGVAR